MPAEPAQETSILVVDDVNAVRVQIREMFRSVGVRNVTLAESPIQAQVALEGGPIDLILADWHMEPTSGLDLLRFVRKSRKFGQIPFLMLSGDNRKDAVVEAVKSGANGYLLKPIRTEQLVNKVCSALGTTDLLKNMTIKTSGEKLLKGFTDELSGFARVAETVLEVIEKDPIANKKLFLVFAERILALRGTAQQLGLEHIVQIATLVEEISTRAAESEKNALIRKSIGGLWDALTSMKYLLKHRDRETSAEQAILMRRLDKTLHSLGGPHKKVLEADIDMILEELSAAHGLR